MADPTFDPDADAATVTGLPGVALEQDGAFFDSQLNYVAAATADVQLIELKSGRTGTRRLVTLAQLATLLA